MFTSSRNSVLVLIVVTMMFGSILAMGGCGSSSGPSVEGQAVMLDAEPENAQNIVDFKSSLITGLNPGGTAVVVGRIGSDEEDQWDTSQATFLLRDLSLETEAHDHAGDDHANCKFCQAEKAKELESMALVRVVDENGSVIKMDARKLLGLKENHIVVAEGEGVIDEDGAFVFDASKIFIRK